MSTSSTVRCITTKTHAAGIQGFPLYFLLALSFSLGLLYSFIHLLVQALFVLLSPLPQDRREPREIGVRLDRMNTADNWDTCIGSTDYFEIRANIWYRSLCVTWVKCWLRYSRTRIICFQLHGLVSLLEYCNLSSDCSNDNDHSSVPNIRIVDDQFWWWFAAQSIVAFYLTEFVILAPSTDILRLRYWISIHFISLHLSLSLVLSYTFRAWSLIHTQSCFSVSLQSYFPAFGLPLSITCTVHAHQSFKSCPAHSRSRSYRASRFARRFARVFIRSPFPHQVRVTLLNMEKKFYHSVSTCSSTSILPLRSAACRCTASSSPLLC